LWSLAHQLSSTFEKRRDIGKFRSSDYLFGPPNKLNQRAIASLTSVAVQVSHTCPEAVVRHSLGDGTVFKSDDVDFVKKFNTEVVSNVVSSWKEVDTHELRERCVAFETHCTAVAKELRGQIPEPPYYNGVTECSSYPYTQYPSDTMRRTVERIVLLNDEYGMERIKMDAAQLALRVRVAAGST
jgi:hypothetical protein